MPYYRTNNRNKLNQRNRLATLNEASKERFINKILDMIDTEVDSDKLLAWVDSGAADSLKIDWNKIKAQDVSEVTRLLDGYRSYNEKGGSISQRKYDYDRIFDDDSFIRYPSLDNDTWIFVSPRNHSSAVKCDSADYGPDVAKWCIGQRDTSIHWDRYNSEGFMFIMAVRKDRNNPHELELKWADNNNGSIPIKYMFQILPDGINVWEPSDTELGLSDVEFEEVFGVSVDDIVYAAETYYDVDYALSYWEALAEGFPLEDLGDEYLIEFTSNSFPDTTLPVIYSRDIEEEIKAYHNIGDTPVSVEFHGVEFNTVRLESHNGGNPNLTIKFLDCTIHNLLNVGVENTEYLFNHTDIYYYKIAEGVSDDAVEFVSCYIQDQETFSTN